MWMISLFQGTIVETHLRPEPVCRYRPRHFIRGRKMLKTSVTDKRSVWFLFFCHLSQAQHSLDSRPSSVSSMSSASWANTAAAGTTPVPGVIAPSGRRGKLIYTPMILVDEATGSSQPLWSDGSASLPAGSRPAWYPGQTRTFTSMRVPPAHMGFINKGSADSLVESVSHRTAGRPSTFTVFVELHNFEFQKFWTLDSHKLLYKYNIIIIIILSV